MPTHPKFKITFFNNTKVMSPVIKHSAVNRDSLKNHITSYKDKHKQVQGPEQSIVNETIQNSKKPGHC